MVMGMAKVQVINLAKTTDKWYRLMLYFQNALPTAFRICLPDADEAKIVRMRLNSVLHRNPTLFNVVITQRECDVYVVKTDAVQKVVIRDEVPTL
jgi:hypothetical protein